LGPGVTEVPGRLVAGFGCGNGTSLEELSGLLDAALDSAGLDPAGLGLLATLDRKLAEPGLVALAARRGLELCGFAAEALAAVAVPSPSEAVERAVGTASVAEAAALLGSGGRLLVPKRRSARATVAIATRLAR
jgi:cobalamin biosynthesis protein CbiG